MTNKVKTRLFKKAETKDEARDQAIQWQADFANKSSSYLEMAEASAYFEKLGEEFGLTEEFKENGII